MEMQFARKLVALNVLAACLAWGGAAAQTAPAAAAAQAAAFDEALELYRQGKWPGAYGRFAALGDRGHAEAARIALLMYRHGARLYGHEWAASQWQLDHWNGLALQRMQVLALEGGD